EFFLLLLGLNYECLVSVPSDTSQVLPLLCHSPIYKCSPQTLAYGDMLPGYPKVKIKKLSYELLQETEKQNQTSALGSIHLMLGLAYRHESYLGISWHPE